MEENVVQEIMSRYLESEWSVKLQPRKVGPDFLFKGKAIETKPTDFKVTDVTNQLARYASEYTEFGLAFPADALNSANLIALHILGTIWYPAFEKWLTVYLIHETPQYYGVLKIPDVSDLIGRICTRIKNLGTLKEKDTHKLIANIESISKGLDKVTILSCINEIENNTSIRWITKT